MDEFFTAVRIRNWVGRSGSSFRPSDQGHILFFTLVCLVVLCAMAGFTGDVGRAYDHRRTLQFAADAAALGAAKLRNSGTFSDSALASEAAAYALINRYEAGNPLTVHCGEWIATAENRSFTPCSSGGGAPCTNCADTRANAIQVTLGGTVPTIFARLVGTRAIHPGAEAVALAPPPPRYCYRPFGIEDIALPDETGQTFTVGPTVAGNWAKIDLFNQVTGATCGGTVESGGFCYYMTNEQGICTPIEYGFVYEDGAEPGDAAIRDIEEGERYIVPVIDEMTGTGNNVPVVVRSFAEIEFIGSTRSGNNWEGTFELVRRDVDPLETGTGGSVALVR